MFGVNMDDANFPGSNLVLMTYPEAKAAEGYDPARIGDLKQVFGGFQIRVPKGDTTRGGDSDGAGTDGECTSFVKGDLTKTTNIAAPCGVVKDGITASIQVKDSKDIGKWTGWVSAPACAKTSNPKDCAGFGYENALSILGAATFGTFALRAILFGAHTSVLLLEDKVSIDIIKIAPWKTKLFLGLNIVWMILSFSLFVWAAIAWQGMCDKIDTGLGRFVGSREKPTQACATTYCNISFSGFFASFAVAFVWFRIPNILIWAGIVQGPETEDAYNTLNQDDEED